MYEMTGWSNFDNHDWHTYGFQWVNTGNNATDQMTYYIDGVLMGALQLGAAQSAFKADMFLTMNLALGGTLGAPIEITDWADTYMDVDYVRWYRVGQPDVCGLDAGTDGGIDSAGESAEEASVEAAVDATFDATVDASPDVGADTATETGADGDSGDGAEASFCTGLPDGTSCEDAEGCNGEGTCQGGSCTATSCPPPQAPSGLTASAASTSVINLSWAASSTSGVTYDVFRSTSATFAPGPSSTLATDQTALTYSDTGLSPSTK
jgi:hypothetical protein